MIAQNDALAHEWFAPAGLNRGITDAIQVKSRLTLAERDDLYEARINPIATFLDKVFVFGVKRHFKSNQVHWTELM